MQGDGPREGAIGPAVRIEIGASHSDAAEALAQRGERATIKLLLVEDDEGDAILVEHQLAEDLPHARVTAVARWLRRSRA